MVEKQRSGKNHSKITRPLSIVLFSVGILLGMALAGSAAWADFEAEYYGFQRMADRSLRGLRCPVLMTRSETGTVTLTLKNPTDKPLEFMARAALSNPGPAKVERQTLTVGPGEKGQLHWTVTSDNIDLGFFIFVQMSTYPVDTIPFRAMACGIVVLPLPGATGTQVFALTLIASLLCMAVGLGLWEAANRPSLGRWPAATWAMRFLAVIVLAAMLTSFLGWWGVAGVCLVIAVLMIVVSVSVVLSQ
jgi:hypothetical protein